MCHPTDSMPPDVPATSGVAVSESTTLVSGDGSSFSAHLSIPASPNGVNLVVLPDARGLHPYYKELSRRFAGAGFTALAVDYYGRTAGVGPRDDSFEWQPLFPKIQTDEVELDVAAAVRYLVDRNDGPVFTVGFCFGGSQSWRLSASSLGLAGVVGFYGQPKLVLDELDNFSAPMLMLVAGADVATPQDEFASFAGKLEAAGKPFEMYVYEGAPHSFFDRAFDDWRDSCADAWQRVLDFTGKHGGTGKHGVMGKRAAAES